MGISEEKISLPKIDVYVCDTSAVMNGLVHLKALPAHLLAVQLTTSAVC